MYVQEMEWMARTWRARGIGPTIPSAYLDGRLPSDSHYDFHLYTPAAGASMAWLASHPPASVVYVSFGSMAVLSPAAMAELALGLRAAGRPFLWVVRASEAHKLPPEPELSGESSESDHDHEEIKMGADSLIVGWCPQLEVLAHEAVGCFVTHCGWNSTVEGLSLGVPMVGMPMWTDQPTNAKYVADVWRVGVRARADEATGVVRREEVERCVREVMEGEGGKEMRRNAGMWRDKAKAAVGEGGSSDRNILHLVAKYCVDHE